MKYTYEGDNKKDALISFMKDPKKAPEKIVDKQWSDTPSEVLHLTTDTFDSALKVLDLLAAYIKTHIMILFLLLGTLFFAGHVLRPMVWTL